MFTTYIICTIVICRMHTGVLQSVECTCSLVQQETNLHLCNARGNMTIQYYFPFPSDKAGGKFGYSPNITFFIKGVRWAEQNLRGPQLFVRLWDTTIRDMDSRLGYMLLTKLACKIYFVLLSKKRYGKVTELAILLLLSTSHQS